MFFKKKFKFLLTRSLNSQPERPHSGKARIKFALKKNLPEITAFALILLVAWVFLQSARFGAVALKIKEKILTSAEGGAASLEAAKNSLTAQDLNLASQNLAQALADFEQAQSQVAALEKDLPGLSGLLPQKKDAERLLSASIDLAEAGKSSIRFVRLASQLSFGAEGLIRGETSLDDLALEIGDFITNLSNAEEKISKTNLNRLPARERELLTRNLTLLRFSLVSAKNLKQLIFLGQNIFTGKKRVLLLLQNQNELRPTGGFLGSFGELIFLNGKIESLQISSIYDLDGQLTEQILPPEPILAVNQRWFLRDANWFASFEESAKKIISFYEKEGGETPDLTIALTPKVIADLLEITGPLQTPQGVKLDQESFIEQLQILTQTSASSPTNEPKLILNQLFTQLFQKIATLNNQDKPRILGVLQQNFINKQILLYAKERESQNILEDFNWAGKLASTDKDFLLVSGANLGGTKTDLFVEQSIKLQSQISQNGQVENTLTITRTNKMPPLNNAQNKTFLRIYVPLGSEFREAKGFNLLSLEKPESLENYKIDPDVFSWEKSAVRDVISGTLIGKESNKTFFGNWVEIKGGESRIMVIKYLLPFKLTNVSRYSLLVQKQPGTQDFDFAYEVSFPDRNMEWKNFDSKEGNMNQLSVQTSLNKDLFFGMVLKQDN